MMPFDIENRAYEARRAELEQNHTGKFAVFHGDEMLGIYDDFNAAGLEAMLRYGDSPSLIRKIGQPRHNSISIIRS
jgi:hypothetical protein